MTTLTQNPRLQLAPTGGSAPKRAGRAQPLAAIDPIPLEPPVESEEPDEPDEFDLSPTDDANWEVFIADDDCDPQPEPGDFWNDEFPNDE